MGYRSALLPGPTEVLDCPLPADGELRVVVVADTHSHPYPQSLAQIAELRPDYILHAGDIGRLQVIDALEGIASTIAVRGNIDPLGRGQPSHRVIRWTMNGQIRSSWLLTHIALRGTRLLREAKEMASEYDSQLIVCGHSHVPFIGREGDISVFNPGSIGPRRFSLPIAFGVVHIGVTGIELEHFNCETGAPLKVKASPASSR